MGLCEKKIDVRPALFPFWENANSEPVEHRYMLLVPLACPPIKYRLILCKTEH